jgi:ubiquinone/menaquinone biosynthesis C-methylase UbiE
VSLIQDFVAGRTPPDLYDTYLTPLFETWSDVLVAAHPPSDHVLDIACGTGIVSRKLAAQADVGQVSAIDIAPPMLDKAKALTDSGAISFHLASAEKLPFEDKQFRAAYCQQGLQFFPDRGAALRDAARVVGPDGRLAFAVWTAAHDGNPVFGTFEDIVARDFGADLVPFGPFSFGNAQSLRQTFEAAGLEVESLKRVEREANLGDPRSLVLFDLLFLGTPAADGALQPLFDPTDASKDDQIEAIISELSAATASFQNDDGELIAPTAAHIVVARIAG